MKLDNGVPSSARQLIVDPVRIANGYVSAAFISSSVLPMNDTVIVLTVDDDEAALNALLATLESTNVDGNTNPLRHTALLNANYPIDDTYVALKLHIFISTKRNALEPIEVTPVNSFK